MDFPLKNWEKKVIVRIIDVSDSGGGWASTLNKWFGWGMGINYLVWINIDELLKPTPSVLITVDFVWHRLMFYLEYASVYSKKGHLLVFIP